MSQEEIIKRTVGFVKKKLKRDTTGHGWWHTYRVWKMTKYIAKKENTDTFLVELSALLHDIADWKLHNGDESVGPKITEKWLEKMKLDRNTINKICDIISNVSFKGENYRATQKSIEGKIVQDADRLDAIGAIGIARVFAFGSHIGSPIHEPSIKPIKNKSVEEYKKMKDTSINHFYEKLLLLKDRMNTETGKEIAKGRHKFMEKFLEKFYEEWDGKS